MLKSNLRQLGKITVIFALLYLFCLAEVRGISPFGIALAFALIITIAKSYIIAPLYLTCNFLTDLSIQNLIISGISASILLIVGLFYINKRLKVYFALPFMLISLSGFLYYEIIGGNIINACISMLMSCVALVIFNQAICAVAFRPYVFRLTMDEGVAMGLTIVCLSCGLACIPPLANINIFHIASIFMTLLAVYTLKKHHAIILATLFGVGFALSNNDVSLIATLSLMSIVGIAFKNHLHLYSALGVIIIDLIFAFFFETYTFTYLNIIETLIGCVTFLSLRQDWLDTMYAYFCDSGEKFASREIVNRNRDSINRKLLDLSNIFNEMDTSFRQMIKGQMSIEDAINMLTQETKNRVCTNCPNKSKCYRGQVDTDKIINDLLSIGFERGKTTLLDISPYLASNCQRVNQLLTSINQSLIKYKHYSAMIGNLDSSRTLIADQLSGVSRICKTLGIKINQQLSFDTAKENMLIEELSYNNIICNEALIYSSDGQNQEISLVVRNIDLNNNKLIEIAEDILKTPLSIIDVSPAEIGGFSIVSMSTSAKYDIVFGYAGVSKTGEDISGDTYSLLRLGDNKFMMAICDGMGNGEKARKTSELAINLIENFYKAGFDNDIILSSVNKLLGLNEEETFTALDLCVIDLNTSYADFIKLGASVGFIKHGSTTDVIETSSLPIGILEKMTPRIHKTVLCDKDIIIICSDGVVDAFESPAVLKTLINDTNTLHPQLIADKILESAISQKTIAEDDMTILVGRLFTKNNYN